MHVSNLLTSLPEVSQQEVFWCRSVHLHVHTHTHTHIRIDLPQCACQTEPGFSHSTALKCYSEIRATSRLHDYRPATIYLNVQKTETVHTHIHSYTSLRPRGLWSGSLISTRFVCSPESRPYLQRTACLGVSRSASTSLSNRVSRQLPGADKNPVLDWMSSVYLFIFVWGYSLNVGYWMHSSLSFPSFFFCAFIFFPLYDGGDPLFLWTRSQAANNISTFKASSGCAVVHAKGRKIKSAQ